MTQSVRDAYIVAATRTPVGKAPRGTLKATRPDDMLAHVVRSVLKQAPSFDPKELSDVVTGCAFPEAEQGLNIARVGALLADLPYTVAGITINRYCSSGLNALQIAADRIRIGEAEALIASGTESMSLVPMMGNKVALNSKIFDQDETVGLAYSMGLTAEKVAEKWKVSRQVQDEFAVLSQEKALEAVQNGRFDAEISPIEVTVRTPNLQARVVKEIKHVFSQDEGPRPSMLVVSENILKKYNLTPIARYVGFQVRGVPAEYMGIGPKEAIPAVLKSTGLSLKDMKWIELNEAFAAQAVAVIRELDLDMDKVNPNGGAIALGHPLGATGAIRVATLIHGMRNRNLKGYGMITMCIGSGMGAAGVVEVF